MKRAGLGATTLLGGSAVAGLLWVGLGQSGSVVRTAEQLERGADIYATNCASCHGAKLEGQPNWKRRLPSGRLPAPPHDASGHTWHHPDDVLFRITKEGPTVVVGGSYESDMPGFNEVLSDDDIRTVLDFIKSTWPERERQHQATMSREKETSR